MGPGDLLVALLGGALLGVLGKWLVLSLTHGSEDLPLWMTVLCGVTGIAGGTLLHGLFFTAGALGIDWWRLAWQVTVGVLLLAAVAVVAHRPHP